MARGLNKVMIIGRIQPNDPELRYTQTGQAVCTLKMVTDESYKDKDGNMVERSEWHTIVFWGKAGEIISQYMKKGRQMYVEGRLQTRKYDDKEGVTRYVTEIVGSDFAFLDSGQRGDGDGGTAAPAARHVAAGDHADNGGGTHAVSTSGATEEDLPF